MDLADPTSLSGEDFLPDGTLLRRFGGRYSAIEPNHSRPYRDELAVGMERRETGGNSIRLIPTLGPRVLAVPDYSGQVKQLQRHGRRRKSQPVFVTGPECSTGDW